MPVNLIINNGLADSLRCIHLAADYLDKKNLDFSIGYTSAFMDRNFLDYDFLAYKLGFVNLNLNHKASLKNKSLSFPDFDLLSFEEQKRYSDSCGDLILYPSGAFNKWVAEQTDYVSNVGKKNFYNIKIINAFKQGSIYKKIEEKGQMIKNSVFIHFRMGDVACFEGSVLNELIGGSNDLKDKIIVGNKKFNSLDEHNKFKPKLNFNKDYLSKYEKIRYEKFFDSFSDQFDQIYFASDGFNLISESLKNFTNSELDLSEIEKRLSNYFFGKFEEKCHKFLIGQSKENLEQTLIHCGVSNMWQKGVSNFPFQILRGVGISRKMLHLL